MKVFIFQPNKREQRKAVVSLKDDVGIKILHTGRIRIGLRYSHVRKRIELQRCNRCMTFGHISRECTVPDLSEKCGRFDKEGHKAVACSSPQRCSMCTCVSGNGNAIHVAGSRECEVYREMLSVKKRQ